MGLKENESADVDVDAIMNNLDQPDEDSSDVNYDALAEMGIEVDRPESKSQPAKKGTPKSGKNSVKDILKELGANTKQFDQESEEFAEDAMGDDNDDESSEDNPKEESDGPEEDLFEITHNNAKRSLTKKEMIELAQKGFDYTQKTQGLSKERMAIQEEAKKLEERQAKLLNEVEQEKQKFKQELDLKRQWDFALDFMRQENPDLLAEIESSFKQATLHYKHPLVDQLSRRIEELEANNTRQSDQQIANQYYSELNSLKESLIPKMNDLGISVDEEAIKQAWISGAKDVKAAVYSLYGDQLNKLLSSKAKVQDTRSRLASRPSAGIAGVNRGNKTSSSPAIKNYSDISRKILGF